MNLIFQDAVGNQIAITNQYQLSAMVQNGQIQAGTMLYDIERAAWRTAHELPEYQAALQNPGWQVNQPDYGSPYGAPPAASPYGGQPANPYYGGPPQFGNVQFEPVAEKKWPAAVGLVSMIVGAVLLFGMSAKFSDSAYSAGYRVGMALGISFWIGVIAFLVWRFALNKKKGFGLLIFGCGFLLVSIGVSLNIARESQTQRVAAQDVSALIRDVMSGKKIEPKDYDEKKYGEMAPMIKLLNDYVSQMQTDTLAINKGLEDLHLETLLTEATLRDSNRIAGGQARLQTMLKLLDKYEPLFKQRSDELPDKVNNSSMSAPLKKEFLSGFNSTKDEGMRSISEFFSIERNFVAKANEMLEFVKSRQGQYRFIGNQITFRSARDRDTYNDYLAEIQRIGKQEDEWRERMNRRAQQRYDSMQKTLNR